MVNDQDFPKLTGGLDKGGGTGQRRIRYYPFFDITNNCFQMFVCFCQYCKRNNRGDISLRMVVHSAFATVKSVPCALEKRSILTFLAAAHCIMIQASLSIHFIRYFLCKLYQIFLIINSR